MKNDRHLRVHLALACLLGLSSLAVPVTSFAQPNVELQLVAITDLSGSPNTANPGVDLPFFQPGESVRITLAATNTGDEAPVRVSLTIALQTDHGSPVYSSQSLGEDNTTDSPLENGETDYYSFDWVVPTNADWGLHDILGSISSPDLSTVYDETTPGPATTAFGDDAWLPAFTIGAFGSTVIIHGYQFFGSIPSWPNDIALDIRDRIVRGRIWTYDPSSGEFIVTTPVSGDAENIFVLNWANESNDNFEGLSEAVAEGLFTALVAGASGPSPDWNIGYVHLIGHSRGAVVASETAQRLLAFGGSEVHATYLDPIWQGVNGSYDDFDVNQNHPSLGTTGVAAWSEADYVDNFYSTDDNGELIELDGSPIDGARNLNLSGRGTGVGHSDVWRWYDGTIDLDGTGIDGGSIQTAWYGSPGLERDRDGFNQSRLGGVARTAMAGTTTGIQFGWTDDGIVNGDFERGPQGTGSSIRPGWNIHGGGGSGLIESNHLQLQLGNEERTHNRIWVPSDFSALEFSYEIVATTGGTPDTLVTSAIESDGSVTILDALPIDASTTDTLVVNLSGFTSQVISLRFELLPSGGTVASTVIIDDVALSTTPIGIAFNGRVFLEGPYSGFSSMNTNLTPELPLLHPYGGSPWSYGDADISLLSMPSDVVDWVLVELRSDTTSASMVARRAGLLLDSGDLRDPAGSDSLAFPSTPFGSYWVVVYHRNHLPVMSSAPVDFTSGYGSWDFTQALANAYGSVNPMKMLVDGSFGMFGCDISSDGQITATDFNLWLTDTKTAATGYLAADCTLDTQTTATDFNLWLANTKTAASSQVPD